MSYKNENLQKIKDLLTIYRQQSGIAIIVNGSFVREFYTGAKGYCEQNADLIISTIREEFPLMDEGEGLTADSVKKSWADSVKKSWRKDISTFKDELRAATAPLPKYQQRLISQMLREGIEDSPQDLRRYLRNLTLGFLSHEQVIEIRDLMVSIRSMKAWLPLPCECYDVDWSFTQLERKAAKAA